ncbi:phage terminase large subunit [Mesorhizobium sp. M1348]|uniref:phage terminase large subunit n=1 Tax=unclassified Mesorhizobium TaxID=325217 RepID=UPI00333C559E
MADRSKETNAAALLNTGARADFYTFVRKVFQLVAPGEEFVPNWHIDAMCFAVMDFLAGTERRLVVNVPPRSLKSIILSVALPAFLLGHDPTKKIVCISYAGGLSDTHARYTRLVMESDWYRRLFPNARISRNPAEGIFTTAQGFRRSTTVGGTLTGLGGNIFIVDDPIKPEDALSAAISDSTNAFFGSTLASRADDKRKAKTILVMQRLHVDDPSALFLAKTGTRHLCLPAIADHDQTFPLSFGRTHLWKAGEPLQAVREPLKILAERREDMPEAIFSAQYLQAPVPIDGGMIKWSWFGTYSETPTYQPGNQYLLSWDTGMADTASADYSVCTVILVRREQYFVLDVIRERLVYPHLKRKLHEQRKKYPTASILMEKKVSGLSVVQELQHEGIGVIAITPKDPKMVRISLASAVIEAGQVFLPKYARWLGEFETECKAFPNGRHDDQLDSLAQAINWHQGRLRQSGHTLFGCY